MDFIDAIESRISCRAFSEKAIEPEKIEALRDVIAQANAQQDLHFELYGPDDFGGTLALNSNMFASSPAWYAALAAPDDLLSKERIGYYGELLVLTAAQLGLQSCWVAGTFDRKATYAQLAEGEVLHDVIPLGYGAEKIPLKQRTIRKGLRARSKKQQALYDGPTPLPEAPEWIQACIDGVWKAPSAINEQPVVFAWSGEGTSVRAQLPNVKSGMEYTDLGIAKLHFELVARACGIDGIWEWGAGGAFVLS